MVRTDGATVRSTAQSLGDRINDLVGIDDAISIRSSNWALAFAENTGQAQATCEDA